MSSFDAFAPRATPWALTEFAVFDEFDTIEPVASHPIRTPVSVPVTPSMTELEAAFEARLADACARAEAAAYARGRADGEQAARETLDAAVADALQALDDATQSVRLHESRWTANAEENIAALAVIVARHVVQREIATDASLVTALVQHALDQYPVEQEITVRLHPDDLAACRGAIAQDAVAARAIRWIPDATVMRGGCLTEGRERIIDGRIDTALERAYRTMAGVQAS